jgi:hypothetical protein
MQVWQRGTSFAVSGSASYTADRWQAISAAYTAGLTVSRQTTSDTTNLPFIQYCARVQRNSGSTVTGTFYFNQPVETANSIPYVGKVVTLSFYARAGANYSATSSVLNASVIQGTGTDQNYLGTYTNGSTAGSLAATLTTTWQRFSFQATISTSATEFTVPFTTTATGTAGANDYFEVTGVQVDIGSVALPVRRNGATIQGELSACQRYYERLTADTAYGIFGSAITSNSTTATAVMPYKVTKRTTPTVIDTSAVGGWQLDDGVTGFTATAIVIGGAYNNTQAAAVTVTSSGMTQYRPCVLVAKNSSTAFIGFSAEL